MWLKTIHSAVTVGGTLVKFTPVDATTYEGEVDDALGQQLLDITRDGDYIRIDTAPVKVKTEEELAAEAEAEAEAADADADAALRLKAVEQAEHEKTLADAELLRVEQEEREQHIAASKGKKK